jgi:isochorismate synthase
MINSVTKADISVNALTKKLIHYAVSNGFAFAVWRRPEQKTFHFLLSEVPATYRELQPENLLPGFAFAPFDPNLPKIFLKADILINLEPDGTTQEIIGLLPEINLNEHDYRSFYHPEAIDINFQLPDFEELVRRCIEGINHGRFEKVVASRRKAIKIKPGSDPLQFLELISQTYTQALVYLVGIPSIGTWMGGTPEALMSLDSKNIFRTVALAGTRKFDQQIPISQVSWRQKEIEEQALVERYIISCFKKIRIREYDEYGPRTFQAGNLLHLKSDFYVDLNQVRYPDLLTVMLRLLHPTSAVCGMPMPEALAFIKEHEGYDRSFYTGFLGPVNIENETHLFVNLRCLKWLGDSVFLYAGAGITADSDPAAEFRESELKMETLSSLIDKL